MHQDYLMRLIEQMTQALLTIVRLRQANNEKEAREHIQGAMRSLLKIDSDLLLLYQDDQVLDHFKDFTGQFVMQKCVAGADFLYELALMEKGSQALRLKKLCLHLYTMGIPKEVSFQKSKYFEKVSLLKEELQGQELSTPLLESIDSYESFMRR